MRYQPISNRLLSISLQATCPVHIILLKSQLLDRKAVTHIEPVDSTWLTILRFLSDEKQLKSQISKLQDYRKHGITILRAARLFSQLRQRRESTRPQRHLLTDVLNHVKVLVVFFILRDQKCAVTVMFLEFPGFSKKWRFSI